MVQTPVVNRLIMSSSLAGNGVRPIRGAVIGQLESGFVGCQGTGAPCNHRSRSGLPSIIDVDVARCVALSAHVHAFHDIFSASDCSLAEVADGLVMRLRFITLS